ncbi:MAG: hypothetical protein JWO69_1713, partial [Thermoleophilia bacterium]|nr:hypothetical protein [Thermoleophilia bacterium]
KAVPTAINRGVPVVMTDPKADVTRSIREICVALSPEIAGSVESQPIKVGRRERRRIADDSRRAAERDAIAQGARPTAASTPITAQHDDELELDFDYDVA